MCDEKSRKLGGHVWGRKCEVWLWAHLPGEYCSYALLTSGNRNEAAALTPDPFLSSPGFHRSSQSHEQDKPVMRPEGSYWAYFLSGVRNVSSHTLILQSSSGRIFTSASPPLSLRRGSVPCTGNSSEGRLELWQNSRNTTHLLFD